LKPTLSLSPQAPGTVVSCDVAAFGTLQATPAQLASLRQTAGSTGLRSVLPATLKHTDDQTVTAIAAVGQAVQRFDLAGTSFTDWGVLAAPRYLGRTAMAAAVQRFATEGAWGISPHLIPHRSLHSLSGTISQVLAIHGPNYGVGGGSDGASEVFLAVSALLERERLPGVWMVLSGWDPEPRPGCETTTPPTCNAVALALTAAGSAVTGWRFHIVPAEAPREVPAAEVLSLERLLAALGDTGGPTQWRLAGGGRLALDRNPAAARSAA
jgi:hypothetical protein